MLGWLIKAAVILLLCVAIFGGAGWFAYDLFVRPYQPLPEEKNTPPGPPPDPSLPALEKALALVRDGKALEARSALYAFLQNYPFSTRLADARAALGEINVDLFFHPERSPEQIRYEVVRGDSLIRIERKLAVSHELLMRFNPIADPRRLQIGQVLYFSPAEFTLIINRKEKSLTLYNRHRFFKEYRPVGWDPAPPKPGDAPVEATVRHKVAWHEGGRVSFGSPDYPASHKWVELSARHYTLYAAEGPKPPGGGLAFPREAMEELSTLLSKNVPVSIQ